MKLNCRVSLVVCLLACVGCGTSSETKKETAPPNENHPSTAVPPPAPDDAAKKSHQAKVRDFPAGTWKVVSETHDGKPPPDTRKMTKWIVKQNHIVVRHEGGKSVGLFTVKVIADTVPAAIDLDPFAHGPGMKGIFDLKGDRLTIAYGAIRVKEDPTFPGGRRLHSERPKDFKSDPASGQVLVILEREPVEAGVLEKATNTSHPRTNLRNQNQAANGELSQPPRLLTPAEIDKGQFLIDGDGLRSWSVEGLSAFQDNSLVFGGDQATRAYLLRELPTAFKLQFDFLQEGQGKTEVHLKGGSASTHPAFRSGKSGLIDLDVTQKRWQRCTLTAAYKKGTYELSVKVEPTGKSITIGGDRSRQDGERPKHFVGFELAAGSKLYLRNLIVVAEEKIGPIDLMANNQVGLFLLLGDDFLRTGRYAQAIEEFTRALVVDPENVVCLGRRAEAYGRMGRAENAEKWLVMGINDCSAIIEKHPKAASTYRWRGLIRAWKGDHDGAIDDSNHALELDPQDAKAYNIRGWAYFNNDLDKAIADYDRSIDIDPKRGVAYLDRSIAYEKRGDLAKAKEDRAKAIQFDSKRFPY